MTDEDRTGTVSWRMLLHETSECLRDAQEARWICEEVSGERGLDWLAVIDDPVGERGVARLDALVARRLSGEPLQYVLGSWPFRHLELFVDRRVLIPRPETEVVAGVAIELARASEGVRLVADLGTGSGAIALAVASELPIGEVHVWATDVSGDALDIARANLAGMGRRGAGVRLAHGSWYDPLPPELAGSFDVVVSNPPYVMTHDPLVTAEVVGWEPAVALFGGVDGLDCVRVIVGGASVWLRPGGHLVVEIGETQGRAAAELARQSGLDDIRIRPDLAGADRMLVARRPVSGP